jgi:hypothetical protein
MSRDYVRAPVTLVGRVSAVVVAPILLLMVPAVSSGQPDRGKEPPTFTKDVAPILQKNCQNCHRRGQVGPFVLGTYEQARKRASDIAAVAEDRQMPPWKPAAGVGPKFKHDKSLSAADVAVLQAWAAAGAPRGEAKHMPPEPVFAEGWTLGKPDLVLEAPEEFAIPASGPDTYRCFVLPTNLAKDTYVSALEFRPGNSRVVHHMSVFIDTRGLGRAKDAAESGPGYTCFSGPGFDPDGELGFWTAGSVPTPLPEGIGYSLARQSDVILQIHYHPSGKPEVDRTRIGVYFAKTPIKQVLHWNDASSFDFVLAPGQSDIEVKASWFVPVDVEALAVSPHMHQLGKDMRMTMTDPDGRTRDLIHIPEWDPSWQNTYFFEKPISMPRGTVVNVIAHFDNSDHERNPSRPPKPVRSGYTVYDEMCVGYIAVVKKGQDLTVPGTMDNLFWTFQKQRQANLRRQIAKQRR